MASVLFPHIGDKVIKIITSRQIYKGRIFDVEQVKLSSPDGKVFVRDVVRHGGSAAVIPLLDKNHIVLVRQFRLPANADLYEIPAGTLDKGENPLQCAKREIIEETGYKARKWKKIAEFYSCPGFCSEKLHLYLAAQLEPVKEYHRDEDEDLEVKIFSIKQIKKMLSMGKFVDSKTLIGVYAFLHR